MCFCPWPRLLGGSTRPESLQRFTKPLLWSPLHPCGTMVHVEQYDLSQTCQHSSLMKPSTSAGERCSLLVQCWGSDTYQVPRVNSCTLGLILLVWLQTPQLSAGSYGEYCFTSVSGNRCLKTPAKGLMCLVLRCDILLQPLQVRYRKPNLSWEPVISRSPRGQKANHRAPPCSLHAGPPGPFYGDMETGPAIITVSVISLFVHRPAILASASSCSLF